MDYNNFLLITMDLLVYVKGRCFQNNNKKVCFLKTEFLVRIEVFYKRFEDYER